MKQILKPKQQSYVDSLTCDLAKKEAVLNFNFENRRKANKKFQKSFKTKKNDVLVNKNTINYFLTDENLSIAKINQCISFCQFAEMPDLAQKFRDKKSKFEHQYQNENLIISDVAKEKKPIKIFVKVTNENTDILLKLHNSFLEEEHHTFFESKSSIVYAYKPYKYTIIKEYDYIKQHYKEVTTADFLSYFPEFLANEKEQFDTSKIIVRAKLKHDNHYVEGYYYFNNGNHRISTLENSFFEIEPSTLKFVNQ